MRMPIINWVWCMRGGATPSRRRRASGGLWPSVRRTPTRCSNWGKLLRGQPGRGTEALGFAGAGRAVGCRSLSNYEVWRELGALALEAGRADVALPQLKHYVSFREYDPEGLVLLGQALRSSQREAEARAAFEKAIVAVKTAPGYRRGELRRWEKLARQELR